MLTDYLACSACSCQDTDEFGELCQECGDIIEHGEEFQEFGYLCLSCGNDDQALFDGDKCLNCESGEK